MTSIYGRLRSRSRLRLRGRFLGLVLLALAPSGLVAQERPGFTIGTDADARVTIRNTSGSIRVIAWDRNEVSVYGSRTVIRDLDIDATPKQVQLRMDAGHELNVRVPRRAQLRAYSGSGSVTVQGVTGSVDIESASGSLEVEGQPRSIHAIGFSGGVTIRGGGTEVTRAESVSGTVIVTKAAGMVVAKSSSGGIDVRGDVREAELFTISGTVVFDGSVTRRLSAESSSGGVELTVPRNMSAEYELSTISADIENDFGPAATKSRAGDGVALRFRVGNGGARIKGVSVSGSIRLHDR
jgi:DUF4097 and DUF4098 domain-containing protein YvlB